MGILPTETSCPPLECDQYRILVHTAIPQGVAVFLRSTIYFFLLQEKAFIQSNVNIRGPLAILHFNIEEMEDKLYV